MSRSLTPEDRVAALRDVVEERLDVLGRALALVLVELQVAIAPVDRPLACRLRVAQSRDREARVLADAVPRWAHLDDVDVALGAVGLDLDLVPQVLRHAPTRPESDAVQISLGKPHYTSVPLSERSNAWPKSRGVDGRADCPPTTDPKNPRSSTPTGESRRG